MKNRRHRAHGSFQGVHNEYIVGELSEQKDTQAVVINVNSEQSRHQSASNVPPTSRLETLTTIMNEIRDILNTLNQLQKLEEASGQPAPPETVAALRKRLPQPVLAHHDRCHARRRKSVVVMGGNGDCGGCHMRASHGLLLSLQRGDEIQVCENCGAYLLWDAASLKTPSP